jgi:serine/threonine-protein kinase
MTRSTTRVGATFGHYEIRRLLGSGGMGEVYEARDTAKDRTVALKILSDHLSHNEVFRERFRRESHAAAKLSEPHVIPIHDWGEVNGALYIDMRLVDGVDLRALLKNGPLDPQRAVAITGQIATALDAAHNAGLIHRDVKPENIIVTPDDFAYLVDFGIAESNDDARLTTVGSAIGSFAYMAPERFGAGNITPAADIYSLACVLHESLTGLAPFPATSLQQVIAAHTSTPPPRPSAVNPAVPASLDDVIARGMAKEPDDRYGMAGAFGRAAGRALRQPQLPSDLGATLAASCASAPTVSHPSAHAPSTEASDVVRRRVELGEHRQAWALPTILAAAVVVIVAASGVTALVINRNHQRSHRPGPIIAAQPTIEHPSVSGQPATAQPTIKSPSVSQQPVGPPTPAAEPPLGARVCPTLFENAGDYTQSAAGDTVTSCEFAEAVRIAYGRSGPPSPVPRVVTAYSPVTATWYAMTCAAKGPLATCTGGDHAVVYAY